MWVIAGRGVKIRAGVFVDACVYLRERENGGRRGERGNKDRLVDTRGARGGGKRNRKVTKRKRG